jgi:hypothetical protein
MSARPTARPKICNGHLSDAARRHDCVTLEVICLPIVRYQDMQVWLGEPGTMMLEGTGFIRPQSLEVQDSSVIDVRTPQWVTGVPYAQMVCK